MGQRRQTNCYYPDLTSWQIIQYSVELPEESKLSIENLKKAPAEQLNLIQDPSLLPNISLIRTSKDKRRFLMGMLPAIARQVLLNSKPGIMEEEAVKVATEVQNTLQFRGTTLEDQWEVCPVVDPAKTRDASNKEALVQL